MRHFRADLVSGAFLGLLVSCGGRPADPPLAPDPERAILQLMSQHAVTGLAVGVVRGGAVVSLRGYGLRDREGALPLTPDTVMYAASFTKATFAWLVMQLAEEGKVDLDRPVAAILPKPLPSYPRWSDLADGPRWTQLTLRMLLSHTSGFANFRGLEDDKKLRFHRAPGTRYGYSGEGINLAQLVLEEGLGLDVKAEMQRRIFDRFGMAHTALAWRDDLGANVAVGYDRDGKRIEHTHREKVRAAGSMDTTLSDWTRFFAAVIRGEGLGERARQEMLSLQVTIDSPKQFPTLLEERTPRWASIHLGYGLGWGVFESPRGPAFFKEGQDDGTSNYALGLRGPKDGIVLLSNDNRAEEIFATVADLLVGPTGLPAEWEGYGASTAP